MEETTINEAKSLSADEKAKLAAQDTRIVSEYTAKMLEINARKHWDKFYMRNENKFFRDRHWTQREFEELLDSNLSGKVLFEVGCGVGNFVFPLLEEKIDCTFYMCDFSERAIDLVKKNPLYQQGKVTAFVADVTEPSDLSVIPEGSVDIITLIFVLSAVHPDKFAQVLNNLYKLLKPGGMVLFRDYGLFDMAQIRFKPGHKIADNFYMRQDGTRAYYFSLEEASELYRSAGFSIVSGSYVHRRTVNKKENIDVPRIFVQMKCRKS